MLIFFLNSGMLQKQPPHQTSEQQYSASSPFIPITDSPASTLDLKSPSTLNENNFPLNIPSTVPPDNNEQILDQHHRKIEELPKNNIISNISKQPSTKNNVERKKERKHSLANLQTMDSILEVSENGSNR